MLLRMALLRKTRKFTAIATAIALVLGPLPARPEEEKGLPILRDTETEQLLRDYSRPILRAAGLEKQNIQVVIINQAVFNAFVADGRRIFVNHGALMQSETPNQIIGVLAHETGHLAGGHLARMREQLAQAQTQMIIAMLLGVGALAAGARSNNNSVNNYGGSGLSSAGAAVLSGPQNMIMRSLLSYQRQQEESADRAGVKFLTATGQSARGMYETFKRFTNESLFSAHGADPYYQSHPMPAERVAALAELARTSPYWDKKDDPALQLRHDMMRAKISAFLERQDTVYRRYPLSDTSLPARYAHAISTYLHGDLRNALAQIDGLIQVQPNNPYFYELRGQALLEGGRPAEAIVPLRKAVQLSNSAPLIEMLLGQALVATDNKAYTDEAINILRNAVARETEAPLGYTQLAMAYGKKGDLAEADLASAQAAFLRGDNKTARDLASRAKTRFAVGTPGWVRADDIVSAKPLPGQRNSSKFADPGDPQADASRPKAFFRTGPPGNSP
jgi:predicted Zn-dependent protease